MRIVFVAIVLAPLLAGGNACCLGDDSVRGMYLEAWSNAVGKAPTSASDGAVADESVESVMAWRIRSGAHRGVALDGLAVVAVVLRSGGENGDARRQTDLLIDAQATDEQQNALTDLAKTCAAGAIGDIRSARRTKFDLRIGEGCALAFAVLETDGIKLRTRRVLPAERETLGEAELSRSASVKLFYSQAAIVSDWSAAHSPGEGGSTQPKWTTTGFAKVGGFAP